MAIPSINGTQNYVPVNSPQGQPTQSKPLVEENVRAQPVAQSAQVEENAAKSRHEKDKQLEEAVDNIQKFISQSARDITFSIDRDSGTLVKVIDRNSKDVIRQIPSEEVVAISRALDKLQGLFVQDKI